MDDSLNNNKIKNKCLYKENDVDEIIPGLFLGNYKASYDYDFLSKHNIKYIIRVMSEMDNDKIYNGITYIHIPIKDNEICTKNLNNLFGFASDFILYALSKNKNNMNNILVHCKRGHHRSASVVAAFLIKYTNTDYISAIRYINNIRPYALSNDKCIMKALYKYYLSLNNNVCDNIICDKHNNRFSICHCSIIGKI